MLIIAGLNPTLIIFKKYKIAYKYNSNIDYYGDYKIIKN